MPSAVGTVVLGCLVVIVAFGSATGFIVLVLGMVRQIVSDLNAQHQRNITTLDRVLRTTIETVTQTVGATVKDTVGEAVKATLDVTMATIVGKPGVPVPQPIILPEDDLYDYKWWTQPDTEDSMIGEPVWAPTPGREDGTVLGPGESIIPGVPLPDMSGERFAG